MENMQQQSFRDGLTQSCTERMGQQLYAEGVISLKYRVCGTAGTYRGCGSSPVQCVLVSSHMQRG